MSRHVVFGTGQIGRLVAKRLVSLGADVTAVNRSGCDSVHGAQVVAGDATDPMFTAQVGAGADAVYFCLNPPRYDNWARDFPPLQHGVLTAAEAAGARLVVLDNLYAYGSTGGRDLVESLPANPASAKAATRAAMTAELLAAHQAGRVEVAIGRASDFFGPGVAQSALGVSRISERDHRDEHDSDPPAHRRNHGQRRHPRQRRICRPRIDLQLPEDPAVPGGRHPGQLPPA